MVFLEQWLVPLFIVGLIFYVIYQNRGARGRQGSAKNARPQQANAARAGKAQQVPLRSRESAWVHIQSAIGSDRPLVPTAQLLRRSGLEVRILRAPLTPGRRLMRLAVRQSDLKRAREILSKEDLFVRTQLHS